MHTEVLYYAVVMLCLNGTCDNHVVSKALPLKQCTETMETEKVKYQKLDAGVIASCVPDTDFE